MLLGIELVNLEMFTFQNNLLSMTFAFSTEECSHRPCYILAFLPARSHVWDFSTGCKLLRRLFLLNTDELVLERNE
jgi:hypothetical protein